MWSRQTAWNILTVLYVNENKTKPCTHFFVRFATKILFEITKKINPMVKLRNYFWKHFFLTFQWDNWWFYGIILLNEILNGTILLNKYQRHQLDQQILHWKSVSCWSTTEILTAHCFFLIVSNLLIVSNQLKVLTFCKKNLKRFEKFYTFSPEAAHMTFWTA